MKFSSSLLLSLTLAPSVTAFVPQKRLNLATSGPLFSSAVAEESKVEGKVNGASAVVEKTVEVVEKKPEVKPEAPKSPPTFFLEDDTGAPLEPGRYADIDYSITLPFFQRPTNLDGSHAGDYGFDPLGLSQEYDLYYMQECELRHARLAMLAVVGWPLSEMLAPSFMLQDGGRAPSVLNGFNPVSAIAVLGIFGAIGFLEYASALRRTSNTKLGKIHAKDMRNIWNFGVAGDYDFDPMNLYSMLGNDAYGRKAMREMEITQGRYAMLGITGFAFTEAISGKAIVENNMFFTPNAVLPVLGVAYLVWSTLYEFSDLREYPITIQKSKLGKEFDEWMERRRDSP